MTTFIMFNVFNSFLKHHFLLLFPCTGNFFLQLDIIRPFEKKLLFLFFSDRPTRFCRQEIRKPRNQKIVVLTSKRTTTTLELLISCRCYSNKIIIPAWFYRLGNLILLILLMMQPFNCFEVYSIRILRSCSFTLYRVFLRTKCYVIGEK